MHDTTKKIHDLESYVEKEFHILEKKINELKKSEQLKLKKIYIELNDLNQVVFDLKNQDFCHDLKSKLEQLETTIVQVEEKLSNQLEKMDKKYSILEKVMLAKVDEQQKQIDHLVLLVKSLDTRINELVNDMGTVKEELKTKISIHPNYFDEKQN